MFSKHLMRAASSAALALALTATAAFAQGIPAGQIKHVLLLSVDGLHETDLSLFAKVNPDSAFAKLMGHGAHFSNASSAKPSDSFPGLLALVTGGSPKSTGVYYDDSYDRALSAPGSDCTTKGTEVVYDESIDLKPDAIDGGGGIDEAKLPRDPANGCKPVYPHQFLRVNTMFEVAKAAGLRTAWSDKHPAYELVNGPSGKGVDDLFVPEINWSDDTTANAKNTAAYDDTKVAAIINEIDGKSHDGKDGAGVPSIFGMNFQAVSVGEKTAGYMDDKGTPSADLAEALKHTDASIGKMLAELASKGIDKETLVILAAKHGQSAMNPALKKIVDKKMIPGLLDGVAKDLGAQVTQDSVALIWLSDQSKTADAVKALTAAKDAASIDTIYDGEKLVAMFADPTKDTRAPDIVVQPMNGVIYTKPTSKKIAEHGGFGEDDTHVALLVSNPSMDAVEVKDPVTNMQVAPTILKALGLDPMALQAVKAEGTKLLPMPGVM
jgi:Type I phosphodiesterase / nucleotide pyrophosphatase